MTLDTLILLTGAFTALLPFLGVPGSPQGIDAGLFFAAGVIMIALGIAVRRKGFPREARRRF